MSYQPHLRFAHNRWKECVGPGATVVDATCGNGHDALYLANLVLTPEKGRLFLIDVQADALQKTRELLEAKLDLPLLERVSFFQQCHSNFPAEIEPGTIDLCVYNLGYLPGGNKACTTMESSTLQSIKRAQGLIKKGGLFSITCYPGHAEGEREQEALSKEMASWSYQEWCCSHHTWINRDKAPSVLFCEKRK